jgi:anti-sigma B factor antagonist
MDERASTAADWDFRVEEDRPRAGTVVLAVVGDADLHAAPELRARLTAAIDEGASDVVLDLSQATFVDSMTLGVLLGGMKRLRSTGGRLQLVVSRPDIRRIFEMTLLDRILPLYATLDDALVPAERDSRGAG